VPFGFLRRDKKNPLPEVAPVQAQPERRGIPFDGLTEEWRLAGRMEIEGRLSDVLNRREAIPITEVCWAPIDGSEEMAPAAGLERVDPFDLIIVFAGAGSLPVRSEVERTAQRLHKVPFDVTLDLKPFRVIGTVFLFPGSEPERLMDRSTDLFVPVTNALALMDDRPLHDPEVEVVLVNRSYLRGVEQVERRTVQAARARLGVVARGPD
jgi:hypothetical protein